MKIVLPNRSISEVFVAYKNKGKTFRLLAVYLLRINRSEMQLKNEKEEKENEASVEREAKRIGRRILHKWDWSKRGDQN